MTHPLAITSLVCGLLSWLVAPLIGAVVAIVCGHRARTEITLNAARYEGDGLALTGMVLGYLHLVALVALIAFFFLFLGGMTWLAQWR